MPRVDRENNFEISATKRTRKEPILDFSCFFFPLPEDALSSLMLTESFESGKFGDYSFLSLILLVFQKLMV